MEKEIQPGNITDNLLNTFNYSFVETAPYGFVVPKKDKYVAVNLVDKVYQCLHCQKEIQVKYHHTGVTYFSRERFNKQKTIYEDLQMNFPTEADIEAGQEFTCRVRGFCEQCAESALFDNDEPEQAVYNFCLELHKKDEDLLSQARVHMKHAIEAWLQTITEASQVMNFDLSGYDALRDLLCAVILEDTSKLETLLKDYDADKKRILSAAEALFEELPSTWQAYTMRPTAIYESMSDELYHEYTVAFPEKTTVPQDFFVFRLIEKTRVRMFLQQQRICTVEELLMEVGFDAAWVDLLVDHVTSLKK